MQVIKALEDATDAGGIARTDGSHFAFRGVVRRLAYIVRRITYAIHARVWNPLKKQAFFEKGVGAQVQVLPLLFNLLESNHSAPSPSTPSDGTSLLSLTARKQTARFPPKAGEPSPPALGLGSQAARNPSNPLCRGT
jgi:hypothetical protein